MASNCMVCCRLRQKDVACKLSVNVEYTSWNRTDSGSLLGTGDHMKCMDTRAPRRTSPTCVQSMKERREYEEIKAGWSVSSRRE